MSKSETAGRKIHSNETLQNLVNMTNQVNLHLLDKILVIVRGGDNFRTKACRLLNIERRIVIAACEVRKVVEETI